MKNKQFNTSTNDSIIREALRARLHKEYEHDPIYRVVDEMGLNHGSVRADMAVINGSMHAFEIKSDLDTLKRLPRQQEAYSAIFDKVTLIVGMHHAVDAMMIVPDWWGIEVARLQNDEVVFNKIREPKANTCRDGLSIARLLWRGEALKILESNNAAYGLRSKPRAQIYQKICEILDTDAISNSVRHTLCLRESWH